MKKKTSMEMATARVQPVRGPSSRSGRTALRWRAVAAAMVGPWVLLFAAPSEGWATTTPPRVALSTGRWTSTLLLSPPPHRRWFGQTLGSGSTTDPSWASSHFRLNARDCEDSVAVVSSPESSPTDIPLDSLLSWLVSPQGSIAAGCAGLFALLLGPVVLGGWWDNTADDPESAVLWAGVATRSNLLAVMACGGALANAIGRIDVDAVSADEVLLEGKAVLQPVGPKAAQAGWFLHAALAVTPAATAVLLTLADDNDHDASSRCSVAAAAGFLPHGGTKPPPPNTPVLDRYRPVPGGSRLVPNDRETYLPNLQALPGRVEFTVNSFLPSNTQAALLVPVLVVSGERLTASVLVLGSNRARSFTPRDIAWANSLATRLATDLGPEAG